ncbi:MAG: helix-turn-helix domain-containing protein [Desulfurococcaceae archaeon]
MGMLILKPDQKNAEWLLEKIISTLKSVSTEIDVISYPPGQRSIDVVAALNKENLLFKVVDDLQKLNKAETEDLVKAERAFGASSVVITEHDGGTELEDDVVYFKYSTKIITPETLRSYLRGEKPLVASIRGNYVLKINPEKFYQRRIKYKYSRGEIARLINVSTKAVYMYETGCMYISLNKAIALAKILGEDIFEGFDLSAQISEKHVHKPCTPRDHIEESIYSLAARLGHEFLIFEKTPIDAVIKGKEPIAVVKSTGENIKEKIENAEKIASRVKTELVVVKNAKDLDALRKRLISEPR